MIIGNIVSTRKISVSEDFNVVKSLDDVIQGLPTLIVGWDIIKKQYPDYDIINRQLSPDLYWTFRQTERRDIFEEDLLTFQELAYQKLTGSVTYIFVDPLQFGHKKLYKIIRKIYKEKKVVSYFYGSMMYIYTSNIIFGLDFKLFTYMQLNVDKILHKIKEVSSSFLIGNEILITYKRHIEKLNNEVKYVPFLYDLSHE
jgi:hypothetical protein